LPINQSLAINYTHDSTLYDWAFENEYLFGPWILVCPVESNTQVAKVYLPGDVPWYDFHSGKSMDKNGQHLTESGLDRLPLYVQSGAIIPMQSVVQSTKQTSDGIIFFHIYNGKRKTEFEYYEDDGDSFEYKEHDKFYRRLITFEPEKSLITFAKVVGTFKSKYHTVTIVFHGFDLLSASINGKEVIKEEMQFISGKEKVSKMSFSNVDSLITLQL